MVGSPDDSGRGGFPLCRPALSRGGSLSLDDSGGGVVGSPDDSGRGLSLLDSVWSPWPWIRHQGFVNGCGGSLDDSGGEPLRVLQLGTVAAWPWSVRLMIPGVAGSRFAVQL